MKKQLLSIALLSASAAVSAQSFLKFAKQINGKSVVNQCATNAQQDLYLTGYCYGTVDLDPSDKSAPLASQGSTTIFLAKYNAAGEYKWAHPLAGSTAAGVHFPMTIDNKSNVLLSGESAFVTDLDPSEKVLKIEYKMGAASAFIAKYNSEGVLLWAKNWESLGDAYKSSIHIESILTDAVGNVYVAGDYAGRFDFDPSKEKVEITTGSADTENRDIFVAKYSSDGNFAWVKTLAAPAAENLSEMAFDSKGSLILLWSTKSDDVDADFTDKKQLVAGKSTILSKYDASGNYLWAKSLGNVFVRDVTTLGRHLSIDSKNNLLVTGSYIKNDFDPSSKDAAMLSNANSEDVFVSKYDADGNYLWARSFGATLNESGCAVVADGRDNVFALCNITGATSVTIDNKTVEVKPQHKDITLLKYDANGTLLSASLIGGNAGAFALDAPAYLHVSQNNQLFVLGMFEGTANFNIVSGKTELTSLAGHNGFFAKYDIGLVNPTNNATINNAANTDPNNKTRTGADKNDK